MQVFAFDLDNTLCYTEGNDYPHSIPNEKVIAEVNRLYQEGNTVKIFTARGSKSGLDWKELTVRQLVEWGVKYHELIMGKPHADFFIDDKAVNIKDFMEKVR